MSNDRIKVAGYSQAIKYTDGIEYRNFTPDLVGLQLASNGGTPLFTMGSFSITTNIDPKINKIHNSSKFSNFVTLADLNLSLEQTKTLLADNAGVFLNLDKTNLDYYALFGSLTEFVRVALENIIINWPASLYVSPIAQDSNGNMLNGFTVENYQYDSLTETATFKANTTFINNKFQLNITNTGSILNTFNETNNLRNFTMNYASYAVLFNELEYDVLEYTASTYDTNDYSYFKVSGNPFSGYPTNITTSYHIKPNKLTEDNFFNTLDTFENYLLNRKISPIYTSSFRYPIKTDDGLILYVTDVLTWPVSDGYNIDFDTSLYADYATKLFNLANSNDLFSSNLINRFLVSESITSFDTTPVDLNDIDTYGGKVNKTLQLYGVEYDKINQFIYGIKFANTVTYDKLDNTPDVYLKNLARVLGWEVISPILENNLLGNYVTTKKSTYSGQSVSLTDVESDIELWRRIILNTPWLWKSKGARKSIEFILNFIGTPKGLIKFNEYVYKVNSPINVEQFKQILRLNDLSDDISEYPIDSDGYPRPLPNNANMYFQGNGLWYRETGGSGATIDILEGNNPHVGQYDGGYRYTNQFKELIPNFTPVLLSSTTITTELINLYTNYDSGFFNEGVTTATTVDSLKITNLNGVDFSDCVVFKPTIEVSPNPKQLLNDCGCETETSDKIMSICIEKKNTATQSTCGDTLWGYQHTDYGVYSFTYYKYNADGTIYYNHINTLGLNETNFTQIECCKAIGGKPFIYDKFTNNSGYPATYKTFNPNEGESNTGYVCCDETKTCGCFIACSWMVNLDTIQLPSLTSLYSGPQATYLQFIKPDGSPAIVTPDGCNCLTNYSTPIKDVYDPYTGEIGYGCQLTQIGLQDIQLGESSVIYKHYDDKANNNISCTTR